MRYRFPRIRGDVPLYTLDKLCFWLFSPHTRGCSTGDPSGHLATSRFPRIRGDVPTGVTGIFAFPEFSPHTRGCSQHSRFLFPRLLVFPAYAGMFLSIAGRGTCPKGFPRIRGDVPIRTTQGGCLIWFSPHTRGCSALNREACSLGAVFPAYAGMFPQLTVHGCAPHGFPRIRGDVPYWVIEQLRKKQFSPHTRGCSHQNRQTPISQYVFPAYAGMFLVDTAPTLHSTGFPRIRGDVPPSRT